MEATVAATAVNGAAPAPAAVAAAPATAEPTKAKKRPGRKLGSKNKPKVVGEAAPKRAYKRKGQRSVCLAPPAANGVACKKRVTSHGLCSSHAITAKGMVEKGLTTWADLIKAGVAKDKHMTPTRKAFLDAVQASKATAPATPVSPVVSHVVPITPIVTN